MLIGIFTGTIPWNYPNFTDFTDPLVIHWDHLGPISEPFFSTRHRDQPWILNSLCHVSFKSCWFYHIFVGSVRCLWLRQRFGSKPFTVERAEYIPRACSVSFSLVVANFITILMQWITPLFDAALPVVVWWYPCFYDKLLFTLTTLFDI